MSVITIPTQNARSTGILLTSANLAAATAGGDTFDRYASHLVLTNGDSAAHTATVTIGNEAPFNVVMAATSTYVVGVSKGKRAGTPDPGGTVTYTAVTSVIVGAFDSE
jgi:hypothetical protein